MRLLIHALALSAISLASIVAGFWVWRWSPSPNQVAVQVPVALLVGVPLMVAWIWRGRAVFRARWLSIAPSTLAICALIVVSGHYLVTGYLTAPGNVFGAWLVLSVEAAIALSIVFAAGRTGH